MLTYFYMESKEFCWIIINHLLTGMMREETAVDYFRTNFVYLFRAPVENQTSKSS